MDVGELLIELYGRVDGHVHGVVDGLGVEDLLRSPAPGTNPVGWLVWHLTRVQDHHVSGVMEEPQLWMAEDRAGRFGMVAEAEDHGWGHTAEQVAAVRPESADALLDYYDAVAARTRAFLARITPEDLDRIVDRRWDPPVTMAVRLISVADDDIQHAGQAAYVRGLLGV